MGREIGDGRIVVEYVLRAIAVMHVPVDDGDAFNAMGILRVSGGDGGLIEQAEAHGPMLFSVMPGRARRNKNIVRLFRKNAVDGFQRGADARQRGLQAFRTDAGVGVNRDDPFIGNTANDRSQVILCVDEQNHVAVRRGGIHALQVFKRLVGKSGFQGFHPVGSFRMTGRRQVFGMDRVRIKPGRHETSLMIGGQPHSIFSRPGKRLKCLSPTGRATNFKFWRFCVMETTAIALIALICTQNNLVCREDPQGISTYQTVQQCTEKLNILAGEPLAPGYKIVGKCVPMQREATGKEWALNWAGDSIGFVERASIQTADAGSSTTPEADTVNQEPLRTADLKIGTKEQPKRISMTLNPETTVN